MALIRCWECGGQVSDQAVACPACGARSRGQVAPIVLVQGRNKLAAVLLAIFLGGLGLHKFYLGRTGAGVLYLLFCWTFIPAVIGFIEGIVYLSMSEQEFNAKYCAV